MRQIGLGQAAAPEGFSEGCKARPAGMKGKMAAESNFGRG